MDRSVLFAFNQSEGSPSYLAQDSGGNLYGLGTTEILGPAAIFVLERTNSGWVFSEDFVHHNDCEADFLNNLTVDAAGNLYGTGGTFTQDEECSSGYIFKASYGSDGWHYQDLAHLPDQIFPASGSLAVDSSGNLYGTTVFCGTNDAGTVWQVSP